MPSPQTPAGGGAGAGVVASSNFSNLSKDVLKSFESKVIAPRNPKLLRTTRLQSAVRMTPSMYIKQMDMNTEQKLASTHEMRLPRVVELLDMSETTHQKVSYVDIDQAMFQPFPSEMYFQNFEGFKTYELPLLLRNNDKIPRLIKVIQTDSPYFRIISPEDVSHKVAPGMASVFKIQFTPEDKKDYTHELICMTEREKFIVPIQAIGARAILDFPDQVNFSTCAVKYTTTKTLLVRNIGNAEAKFSLDVNLPFSSSVSTGCLSVGDSMQITLDFNPIKVGDHCSDLLLKYDSGEKVIVSLYGAAVDANVRLDKNSIKIDNTFIQLANQRTVSLHNRSDMIVHYRWSRFATHIEEESQKERFVSEISEEERLETERFLHECTNDPTLRDRMAILTRTFVNRREIISSDPLLFNDTIFSISPVEGDIWPNSTSEITVVFKPKEATLYSRTIFCDITGRESRLPLKLRGEGMGPKLVFSYDSLDIGSVFAGSSHTYEIVVSNKGDIDAIFSLAGSSGKPPKAGSTAQNDPRSKFQFETVEGIVLPGGHQALEVTFKSDQLGEFSQDFYFNVDGSPEQLKFNIKGCVIGPTFHFDVPRLRFGNISYGFVHSKLCLLQNTSLVPMLFNLRVQGDGNGELSIASTADLDSDMDSVTVPDERGLKEFDVMPAQGTIGPQSKVQIQVSVCTNTLKRYDYALVVDVHGVGTDILSLPITAQTVVPAVQVMSLTLNYGRCFLNHPYQLRAKLLNDSDLPAKYDIVNQIRDELTPIMYGSPLPKGIVEPHSLVEVPILMQAVELGNHDVNCMFSIFGSLDPPLSVQLKCIGEGPVVHITPEKLCWGSTNVLQPDSKTVQLSNESLIPAQFFIKMIRPDSLWSVSPDKGEIPPDSSIDITVTAVLDDCIKFQDKMTVHIVKGSMVTIPLSAQGTGTTIVTNPPLSPAFELGPHFAKSRKIQKIKITNKGRRHQALVWCTEGFAKQRHRRDPFTGNLKDMKVRDKVIIPFPPSPVFSLYPSRFALEPGQTIFATLEGTFDKPQKVKEKLICHAIIGKANGKEKILKCDLTAEFVAPLMMFSQESLYFRIDKRPEDPPFTLQTASFRAKNVSSLPLTCVMSAEYPFQFESFGQVLVSTLELNLSIGQEVQVTISFDPAFKDDLHSRIAESQVTITYKEHPQIESVRLKGEVNFPNLDLSVDEVDFDCILNDTEVARFVDITNNSPMPVSYRWSFLIKKGEENIKYNGTLPVLDANAEQDYEVKEIGYDNPDEVSEKYKEVRINVMVRIFMSADFTLF